MGIIYCLFNQLLKSVGNQQLNTVALASADGPQNWRLNWQANSLRFTVHRNTKTITSFVTLKSLRNHISHSQDMQPVHQKLITR